MDFENFVPELGEVKKRTSAGASSLERWLLVGVHGRAIVRKTWVDGAELTASGLDRLGRERAPDPDLDSERQVEHRALDASSGAPKPARCTMCAATPGGVLCSMCGGTGWTSSDSAAQVPCTACKYGQLVCPTCDGEKSVFNVRIAYGVDQPTNFAHVFLPNELEPMRNVLLQFVKQRTTIPDCLNIDLFGQFESRGAYRSAARSDYEHRGHRLGGAVELARRYVTRLSRLPSVVASRYQANVWPVACFTEADKTIVLVIDENQNCLSL